MPAPELATAMQRLKMVLTGGRDEESGEVSGEVSFWKELLEAVSHEAERFLEQASKACEKHRGKENATGLAVSELSKKIKNELQPETLAEVEKMVFKSDHPECTGKAVVTQNMCMNSPEAMYYIVQTLIGNGLIGQADPIVQADPLYSISLASCAMLAISQTSVKHEHICTVISNSFEDGTKDALCLQELKGNDIEAIETCLSSHEGFNFKFHHSFSNRERMNQGFQEQEAINREKEQKEYDDEETNFREKMKEWSAIPEDSRGPKPAKKKLNNPSKQKAKKPPHAVPTKMSAVVLRGHPGVEIDRCARLEEELRCEDPKAVFACLKHVAKHGDKMVISVHLCHETRETQHEQLRGLMRIIFGNVDEGVQTLTIAGDFNMNVNNPSFKEALKCPNETFRDPEIEKGFPNIFTENEVIDAIVTYERCKVGPPAPP